MDSSYTLDPNFVVRKRLPALTETDLKMIPLRIVFTLYDGAAFAPQTAYSMRLTLVTADDKELVIEGKIFYY